MNRIKTGDNVVVIAGKSKGHQGKVLKVLTGKSKDAMKIIVEGANLQKKHVKPNPNLNQQGGILEREAALHISNVAHFNPETQKADRVGFKMVDGKKVRYYKSNDKIVDVV